MMLTSPMPSGSRPYWWSTVLWAAFGSLITLSIVGAMSIGLQRWYEGRVYPGVQFAGRALGGLTRDQAAVALSAHAQRYTDHPVLFVHGEREWWPSATEIGLHLDLEAMVEEALSAGRSGDLFEGIRNGWRALARDAGASVPVRLSLDQSSLTAYLTTLAGQINRTATDASIIVDRGQVRSIAATTGERLDIARTMAQTELAAIGDAPARIRLVVVPQPPVIPNERTHQARAVAEAMVSGPLVLRYGDRAWTWSPALIGAMVVIQRVDSPDGPSLAASLDRRKVAAQVSLIAEQIDRTPLDTLMRMEGNQVIAFRESRTGLRSDQQGAVEAVLAHVTGNRREIALSVADIQPSVTHAEASTITATALLSTGRSSFKGSPPERANNIKVAAARLNGVVIPPGTVFSFLRALGPITRENGYLEGLTIQGDATVPGIGGGVCQVSTTAFRAAFWAGLPIVERHPHAYRVGYYEQDGSPVGFDAAVYDPGVDLRFRNDTGGHIVIRTSVDLNTGDLMFQFHGNPADRQVRLLGPTIRNRMAPAPRLPDTLDPTLPRGSRKQVEWAAEGMEVTIGRVVTQGSDAARQESFNSRFTPWREKWVVGTA